MPWRVDTFDVWWLRMNKSARLASTLRMIKAENSEETVTQWHEKTFFSGNSCLTIWVLYGVYSEKRKNHRKGCEFPFCEFFQSTLARAGVGGNTATPTIGWTWEAKLENCFSYTPADGSRVCVACNGIPSSSGRIFPTTFGCVYGWEGREAGKKQKTLRMTNGDWLLTAAAVAARKTMTRGEFLW